MLYSIKKFIQHYASATIIDVLHSPFVFKLYNDCIKNNSHIKLEQFTSQSSGYINRRVDEIIVKLCKQNPTHIVTSDSTSILPSQPFILILENNSGLAALQNLLSQAHNDSIVVVKNMYANESQQQFWNDLKNTKQVTASVDLFFLCFVFVRKEQQKQTFRLRLF